MKVVTYISTALLGFVLLTPGMASAQSCEQLLAPFFQTGVTGFTVGIAIDQNDELDSSAVRPGIGQNRLIFMDGPELTNSNGDDFALSRCFEGNCNQIIPSQGFPAGQFMLRSNGTFGFFQNSSNIISSAATVVCRRNQPGVLIETRFDDNLRTGVYSGLVGRRAFAFVGLSRRGLGGGVEATCSTYDEDSEKQLARRNHPCSPAIAKHRRVVGFPWFGLPLANPITDKNNCDPRPSRAYFCSITYGLGSSLPRSSGELLAGRF